MRGCLWQRSLGTLAFYPDKAVELGDSWSEKTTLTAGFAAIAEHKWTLQKREAGVATLDIKPDKGYYLTGKSLQTQARSLVDGPLGWASD